MKGYKATYNMTCRDVTYEVGKIYKIKDQIEICRNGYHYCKKMVDILEYYSPSKDFVVIEIEDLGDQSYTKGNKTVTNKMKVVRVVPPKEYEGFKLDSNSNLVYTKYSNGIECWKEYNSNGKVIHYKDSNGYEDWREYDDAGNLILYKDSTGVVKNYN